MVLSLSPGPTAIDKREEVSKFAQMWRISDDVWDVWYSTEHFPQGVKNQFPRAALWAACNAWIACAARVIDASSHQDFAAAY